MSKVESPESYVPIGKEYLDRAGRYNEETVNVRDLSKEITGGYNDTLYDVAHNFRVKHPEIQEFYIQVLTKSEKLIQTALRNYFVARISCPTPNYDQAVFKVNMDDTIEFLWVVPSKKVVNNFYPQRFDINIRKDPLMPYVIDFVEGKLFNKALFLNNEV